MACSNREPKLDINDSCHWEKKVFQRWGQGPDNGFRNKFLRSYKKLRRGEGKKKTGFDVPVSGVTAESLQLREYKVSWEDSTMQNTSYSLQDNDAVKLQKPEST